MGHGLNRYPVLGETGIFTVSPKTSVYNSLVLLHFNAMDSSPILLAIGCALYLVCIVSLWRGVRGQKSFRALPWLIPGLIVVTASIHGYLLQGSVFAQGGPRLSLALAFSLAGWVSVVTLLLFSFTKNTINLGLIVLPIGVCTLLASAMSSGESYGFEQFPQGMGWHVALAISTSGIFFVAFAQACMLIIQDRQLHQSNPGNRFPALPAIQTMETNLFWMTLAGFLLMTLNLAIGMASHWNNMGVWLEFNHHVLLSLLAWLGFTGLLAGRKIAGWRGETAARWTIVAFLVLVLAYFGTRFVNELILNA